MYLPSISNYEFEGSSCDLFTQKSTKNLCVSHLLKSKLHIYCVTNNIQKWVDKHGFVESHPSLTIVHLSSEKIQGVISASSLEELFSSILAKISLEKFEGVLVIPNQNNFDEVKIDLAPMLLSLKKLNIKHNIEFYLELVVKGDSVNLEFLWGKPYIVGSEDTEFYHLCSYLVSSDLVLICTSSFDTDTTENSILPIHYALFPNSQSLLVKKLATKEHVCCPVFSKPLATQESSYMLPNFIENFPVETYKPEALSSRLHDYFAAKSQNSVSSNSKKLITNAINNITKSFTKKRKK